MGGDSCESDCMRGLLLVFNVIFVMIGLGLIGIGIYVKVDNNFASILSQLTTDGSLEVKTLGFLGFVLIGGGVFTLLVALLGCLGALWKNRCFLYMYAIILVILMIIELVGFILAFVYKGKLKDYFEKPLIDALKKGLEKDDTAVINGFAQLENALKCCGANNITDYPPDKPSKSAWCKANPNSKGCAQAIIDWFSTNLPIIGGVLGGILAVELFALIGACLAIKISGEDSTGPSVSFSNYMPRRR